MTLKQQSFTAQDVGSFWSSLLQAAAFHQKGTGSPCIRADSWSGMGKARMELKLEEREGHWSLSEIGAQQVPPSSDMDRYVQAKQEKYFHPGNTATGQQDSVGLPAYRLCYSSLHSTSAEHRGKLGTMRS